MCSIMKIIDVADPQRIDRMPDKTIVLLSDGSSSEKGYIVRQVSLRSYPQKIDAALGTYSLITVLVETDRGSIEMTYDEGYRGENALEEASKFLINHLGISGLILRSVLQLEHHIQKDNLSLYNFEDLDERYYEV